VIAPPVSTGYGVGGAGVAALEGALQSCSVLTAVNVDAGFVAGAQAGLIARAVDAAGRRLTAESDARLVTSVYKMDLRKMMGVRKGICSSNPYDRSPVNTGTKCHAVTTAGRTSRTVSRASSRTSTAT